MLVTFSKEVEVFCNDWHGLINALNDKEESEKAWTDFFFSLPNKDEEDLIDSTRELVESIAYTFANQNPYYRMLSTGKYGNTIFYEGFSCFEQDKSDLYRTFYTYKDKGFHLVVCCGELEQEFYENNTI